MVVADQGCPRPSQPWWKVQVFVWEPVLFGTWDGVFTTCMINIFGVVLFLRTGYLVVSIHHEYRIENLKYEPAFTAGGLQIDAALFCFLRFVFTLLFYYVFYIDLYWIFILLLKHFVTLVLKK